MAEPETQVTADEVTEVIQEVKQAKVIDDPPVEVKLSTGQVYRGANQQEVIDQLVKAQENASARIKEQGDSINAMQQVRQPEVQQPKEGEFDKTHYWTLWADDPMKAQAYQNGFDPTQQELRNVAEQNRKRGELDNFKATVGWQPTPQEAASFAGEFTRTGLQPTAINLEVVYGRMIRAGTIGAVQAPRRNAPAPLGRGAGETPGVNIDQFSKLTADQMAEVIGKLERG
jgi:hypothetical protein|tara:strand:- start:1071 stop:1757 length:687 start_codon:yes stop_codon:yes gene_type:complete